jgi:NhaP-type Na+/H+ or K+/H+ antiporter
MGSFVCGLLIGFVLGLIAGWLTRRLGFEIYVC